MSAVREGSSLPIASSEADVLLVGVRALGLAMGLLLLPVSLVGCGDDPIVLDLRVISPGGGEPGSGADVDTLRLHYRRGDEGLRTHEEPVVDGRFDIRFPIDDMAEPLSLAIELVGPDDHLLGALPRHAPFEAHRASRLVVGPPGTCVEFPRVTLPARATHAGAAPVGTFGLFLGGETDGTPSDRVGYVDLLRGSSGELEDAHAPLGRTQVAAVTYFIALVLPTATEPFFYDLGNADDRILPVTIHAGARDGGALVHAEGFGAAVVGGRSGGQPVAEVTYVRDDGSAETTGLAEPRSMAAVAFASDRVFIAAGEGASTLEVMTFGEASEAAVELGDGERLGASLFVSAGGGQALLVGGHDGDGALREDTVWIRGCPMDCSAEPGPLWETAREGAVSVPELSLLVGGNPRGDVEEVVFDPFGGPPAFVGRGALTVPRIGPGVVRVGAGVIIVAGGADATGARRDAEICFPLTLDP